MLLSLTSAVEAVLFAAGSEGLRTGALAEILQVSGAEANLVCDALSRQYNDHGSGLALLHVDDVWQLVTRAEFGPYLSRMANGPQSAQLSNAAIEVLAIVAYQQPITRVQVEGIRGVQSDRAIATLVHRQLIHEVGRLDAPGRPILYGTTPLFLQSFGFTSLEDLPPPPQNPEMPQDLNLFDTTALLARD